MRLNKSEVEAIKSTYANIFPDGLVYLFGSRVDDHKKGGDIDLYLVPDQALTVSEAYEKKSQFRLELKDKIGEQKIDIIIAKDKTRSIEKEALNTGVLL